jgi:hypothetical protein
MKTGFHLKTILASFSFEVTRCVMKWPTGQRSPGAGIRWVVCPTGMVLGGHIIILSSIIHVCLGGGSHGSRRAASWGDR